MSPIEFHGKCCLLISCNHKFIIFMFNDSLYVKYVPNLLPSPAWAEGTVLCLFVCVCVLPQNCCKIQIISNSKQATAHKLGNLRQIVVLYKTGKFLQAKTA